MNDSKAKEARREYQRQWRKKNPNKLRQYAETYWQKKAAELAAGAEPTRKEAE